MAESAGTLAESFVRIRTDDSAAVKGMAKFRGAFSGQMASLKKMAVISIGVVGGVMGFRALMSQAKEAIGLWGVQEQAQARLAGVIKATGGAAGLSAKEMQDYASELQKISMSGDEDILTGMAKLGTFKKVMGDEFKRATKAATDFAALGLGSVSSASMQLGKALQDPSVGLTMLNRAGITFTQQQREQIKGLQAAGKLREAQAIILDEVEGQMSGIAETMSKTDTGKLNQMNMIIGDLKEEIGKALMPIMLQWKELMVSVAEKSLAAVQKLAPAIEWIAETWGKVSGKLKSFAKMGMLVAVVTAGVAALSAAFSMIAPFVLPIVGWVAAIGTAIWAVKAAWDAAMSSDSAEAIKQDLRDIWTNLKLIWENVRTTFGNLMDMIREKFGGVGDGLKNKIGGAVEWVTDKLNTLTMWIGVLSSNWGRTWDVMKLAARISWLEIKQQFLAAVQGMVGVFGYLSDNWQRVLATVIDLATMTWGAIGAGLSAAFAAIDWVKLGDAFGNLVKTWLAYQWGLVSGFMKTFEWIAGGFKDLVNRIFEAWKQLSMTVPVMFGTAIAAMLEGKTLGQAVVEGLSTGIENAMGGLDEAFSIAKEAGDEMKAGFDSGFGEGKEFLGVTQGIGESLGEIGSQMGTAARAAVGPAMQEMTDRIGRMKSELSNMADAYETARAKAMENGPLSPDEQAILDAAKAEIALKTAAMKKEFDARKKAMEEQKKAVKESAEDAAGKWGDEKDEKKKDEDASKKEVKSESVGILGLQKKMQDIFGGQKDPVVDAVKEGNEILGQIRDGKGGAKGDNAGVALAKRRGQILDPEKMADFNTPFRGMASAASGLFGAAASSGRGAGDDELKKRRKEAAKQADRVVKAVERINQVGTIA